MMVLIQRDTGTTLRNEIKKLGLAILFLTFFKVCIVVFYLDVEQTSRNVLRDLPVELIMKNYGHVTTLGTRSSKEHHKKENVINEQKKKHVNVESKQEYPEELLNKLPLKLNEIDVLQEVMLKRKIDKSVNFCNGSESVLAVAFINSKPGSSSLRNSIRLTWGKDGKRKGIVTLFLLGRGKTLNNDNQIEQENERHGDILQGIFLDSFRSSSLKALMAFKWVQTVCPQTPFILMVNDVNFVNYNRLFKILENFKKRKENKFLLGHVITNHEPTRNVQSQYFISVKQFKGQVFPPFCTGDSGFVISMKAAECTLKAALNTTFIPIADVFIAVLAEKVNVDIIDDPRFSIRNLNHDLCSFHNIITARGFNASISTSKLWNKFTDLEFLKNCPKSDVRMSINNNFSNSATVFRLLVDSPNLCKDDNNDLDDVFMVALISTLPKHVGNRDAIRTTWGRSKEIMGMSIRILFVMGRSCHGDEEYQAIIREEQFKNRDIIQADFCEDFQNLTPKFILGLKWVTRNCPNALYMFKGDDDMFVNFENIIGYILGLRASGKALEKFYLGSVMWKSKVIRNPNSDYYVPIKTYSPVYFPPYCSGGGYILSTDVLPAMYSMTLTANLIPIADAFLGILAKGVGIIPKNHIGFKTQEGYKTEQCYLMNVMVGHGPYKTPAALHRVWRNFTDTRVRCFRSQGPKNRFSNANTFDTSMLRLLVDSPDLCKDDNNNPDDVFMVALISTLPEHAGNRDAIRKTWGRSKEIMGMSIRILFVMARSCHGDEKNQSIIREEQSKYRDVIQADFCEDFQNLTLKIILGLKWVTRNCPKALYMYKGDDDVFVNFENIIGYILNLRANGKALEKFYIGSVMWKSKVIRTPNLKYYVPTQTYNPMYFPPYCSGGGYILSTDVLSAMYSKAFTINLIPIDDAFLGILAKEVGVIPKNHIGFKTHGNYKNHGGYKTDQCHLMNVMVKHGPYKSPVELYRVWRNFTDTRVGCFRSQGPKTDTGRQEKQEFVLL